MRNLIIAFFCVIAADALALINPEKVYLVVNDNDPDSMSIAQNYCRIRDVPMENILVNGLSTIVQILYLAITIGQI